MVISNDTTSTCSGIRGRSRDVLQISGAEDLIIIQRTARRYSMLANQNGTLRKFPNADVEPSGNFDQLLLVAGKE
jgi:hypothetical protein